MKWGVSTTLIGLCFGVTSLSVVIAERFKKSARLHDAWVVPLPDGVIDRTTGAPIDLRTLKEVVADNVGLNDSWLRRISIHLGIPSVSTYMQALSARGDEEHTVLSRELPGMVPGEYMSTCITDTSTLREARNRMVVAARRDTLQSYIAALGALQGCVMSISPVQIARYNLHVFVRLFQESGVLAVIVVEADVIEMVCWSSGVLVDSEHVDLYHEPTSKYRALADLVHMWGARRNPFGWLVMGDEQGRSAAVEAVNNAGFNSHVIDPLVLLSSLGCCESAESRGGRSLASSACSDAIGVLAPHMNFKAYVAP